MLVHVNSGYANLKQVSPG